MRDKNQKAQRTIRGNRDEPKRSSPIDIFNFNYYYDFYFGDCMVYNLEINNVINNFCYPNKLHRN